VAQQEFGHQAGALLLAGRLQGQAYGTQLQVGVGHDDLLLAVGEGFVAGQIVEIVPAFGPVQQIGVVAEGEC
jgi:hypothetical protein